jgi:hypothetical protein
MLSEYLDSPKCDVRRAHYPRFVRNNNNNNSNNSNNNNNNNNNVVSCAYCVVSDYAIFAIHLSRPFLQVQAVSSAFSLLKAVNLSFSNGLDLKLLIHTQKT